MSIKVKISAIFTFAFLLLALGAPALETPSTSSVIPNVSHSSSPPASPDIKKGKTSGDSQSPSLQSSILDTIEKLFRIAAYIIGGLWVYFNFWKGRTYKPRLDPMITGQLLNHGESKLVKIVIKIKNVGLSKVDIEQEGTALRLFSYDPSNENDSWKRQFTISILLEQKWIEPQETVGEQFLFSFSETNLVAVKAEVILVSKKTMWGSSTIVT